VSKVNLFKGDCLEVMRGLEDNSINLIVTDPPYNISKAEWDKWKTQNEYVEWCGKWILECQRVLKDNGSFYFFHNDMVQIAQLMEWIRENTKFVFNSFIIWDKGDFKAFGWKNPNSKITLKSWFNTCEYILCYTFQGKKEKNKILNQPGFENLMNYFKEERKKIGWNYTQCDAFMGIKASYCFWDKNTTHPYTIPTEKNYKKLQETGFWQRPYEEIKKEFECNKYIHNLDENHNNVWKYKERNNGKLHPTQKPNEILERIIKTSSNEGHIVLDLFMGSGSTGVAAINTNRDFIGIEMDDNYFEIAKERIDKALEIKEGKLG